MGRKTAENTQTPSKSMDFQIFAKPASYRCNLHCSYCYYLDTKNIFTADSSPCMDDEMLEAYIHQHIQASSTDRVHFSWHGGEPTLLGVDYFRRIVALQKKYCPEKTVLTNGIQTNGTLIDDQWAQFLAENNFSVGISLDGPAEIHNVYRCNREGRGSHEKVMRGFACLAAHGVKAEVLCVLNDYNVLYPFQVYQFFKEIGAEFISFLPLVEPIDSEPGSVVSERSVHPEAFGAFLCTIFDRWMAEDIGTIQIQIIEEALRTAFQQDHSLCLFRPICGDIPVLEYNGDLYACDHFVKPAWRIGNIMESDLAELLKSRELRSFGERKKSLLPQKCRNCEVLAMCNGECPKNRFVNVEEETEKINYLCSGYQLFFNHCKPLIEAIAAQWQSEQQKAITAGKLPQG